jgi:hypothetical protein
MRGIDTEQKVRDVAKMVSVTCDQVFDNTGDVDPKEDPSVLFGGNGDPDCIFNRDRVSICDYKADNAATRICYCVAPPSAAPSTAPTTALEGCIGRINIWNFFYKWLICFIKKVWALLF